MENENKKTIRELENSLIQSLINDMQKESKEFDIDKFKAKTELLSVVLITDTTNKGNLSEIINVLKEKPTKRFSTINSK